MAETSETTPNTIGLSTKVEEDFVVPLTIVRGSLEILQEYDTLSAEEMERFLGQGLRACAHLEKSVRDLSSAVYAAGNRSHEDIQNNSEATEPVGATDRITIFPDLRVIELDLSDLELSSSGEINQLFNKIDNAVDDAGGKWYFAINQRACQIWPEAWIAFAHRSKRLRVTCSLGTVRYAEDCAAASPDMDDPDFFRSRDAAFERLAELKAAEIRT